MIPLKPLGPVRDRRLLVFVSCAWQPELPRKRPGNPPQRAALAGTWVQPIGSLHHEDKERARRPRLWLTPNEDVWQALKALSPHLLIVFGDAARDLSLLGEPPGFECVRRYGGAEHAPHVAWAQFRAKRRPGGGWHRSIDMMQLGNIHPERELANAIARADAALWLNEWRLLLRDHDLGRFDHSMGRQAMRSLRHMVTPKSTIWQHRDHDLHRWEYEVRCNYRPVRRTARDGEYPELWRLDFNGFYPRIMAETWLPGTLVDYWEDAEPDLVDDLIGRGYLVMGQLQTPYGAVYPFTTQHRPAMRLSDRILRVAAYKPAAVLCRWAERMLNLRDDAPPIVSPAAKALSVALWGRLTQKSYAWLDVTDEMSGDDIDELLAAREAGIEDGVIDFGEFLRRIDDDGNVWQNDAADWGYYRWHAVGAHVLAEARARMTEAMLGCDVVYAHTDSVYSTCPIPYAEANPQLVGDLFTYERVEDVTLKGGVRIVDGNVEAHHGTPRQGHRWLWRDDLSEPGDAHYMHRGDL